VLVVKESFEIDEVKVHSPEEMEEAEHQVAMAEAVLMVEMEEALRQAETAAGVEEGAVDLKLIGQIGIQCRLRRRILSRCKHYP